MRVSGKALGVALCAVAILGCGRAGRLHRTPQELAARAATVPPEIDQGRTVSQLVNAVDGGVVTAADGSTLTIPPRALDKDTIITVNVPSRQTIESPMRRYAFGPPGTRFSEPATLAIAYRDLDGGEAPRISVYHSSTLNPIVPAGTELTNWTPAELEQDLKGHVARVTVEHFSFFYAYVGVDRPLYVVTDIPAKFLKPGDVIFHLSKANGDRAGWWKPGHVGLFCGNVTTPEASFDRVIESDGVAGEGVGSSTLGKFKAEVGIFLGARRVANGLTPEEQHAVSDFAVSQLGKGYNLIGTGVYDESSFSCVGLADAALRAVGKSPVSFWQRSTALTPIELFEATEPVSDLEVEEGEELVIPVSVAQADHRSSRAYTRFAGWYSTEEDYALMSIQLPPGATFDPAQRGHVFKWTPGAEHGNRTFVWEFEVRVDNQVTGYARAHRKLEIRVRGKTQGTTTAPPQTTTTTTTSSTDTTATVTTTTSTTGTTTTSAPMPASPAPGATPVLGPGPKPLDPPLPRFEPPRCHDCGQFPCIRMGGM